jgi:hypothetical protein
MGKAMRWLVWLAKILGLYIMRGVGIALCVIIVPIYSVFDRLNDFGRILISFLVPKCSPHSSQSILCFSAPRSVDKLYSWHNKPQ